MGERPDTERRSLENTKVRRSERTRLYHVCLLAFVTLVTIGILLIVSTPIGQPAGPAGNLGVILAFLSTVFILAPIVYENQGERDWRAYYWGYEPRAGFDPDRGGGV